MNQCDGCKRGLPVDSNGNHKGPGGFWAGDVQRCTADLYDCACTDEDPFACELGNPCKCGCHGAAARTGADTP